jgi:hypothetical protein
VCNAHLRLLADKVPAHHVHDANAGEWLALGAMWPEVGESGSKVRDGCG